MAYFSLIAAALIPVGVILWMAASWLAGSRHRRQIAQLQGTLGTLQEELAREQGKAHRLAGFIGRLQAFGVSPTGESPQRSFAEALIDVANSLLKAEQVVLFRMDPTTLELYPVAARGFSPQVLSQWRVSFGDGPLGRAAQGLKAVLQNSPDGSGPPRQGALWTAPYVAAPLVSQNRCSGLLLFAKPETGSFEAEAKDLGSLLASQAALTLEDHAFSEALWNSRDQLVESLSRAIEAKDMYTHAHSDRTRALVRALSKELALPEILILQTEHGALLHDVGKIGIPDAILKKPGDLTPEEYAVMKHHPRIGHRIIEPAAALRPVGSVILYHQEWYNGAGYPEGLAGEEIPLAARIVQIIDAWDAMTSDRPYRKALPRNTAVAELRRNAGTQFDPKLVEVYLRVIDRLEREGIPTTEMRQPAAT
jgi:HD-GYP domain-containing protein (c-di-GMP phosphodiesterase class II)